jgi:tetratricopeptide (TPR) repeat protein/DNA-binding SARP family transcriptional activator
MRGEPVEFKILGPTALEVDGRRIPLGAAKQRGMLALLLYHVREPVRADSIIEHLWNGQPLRDRRASLYALASRIRAILNDVGIGNVLVRLPGAAAYRLDIDPLLIDFHRFRRIVSDARQAARHNHHDTAARILAEAIALWRGEPIADLRGSQSEHLRGHMNGALLDAHRLLADSQLRIGQHQSVLARLEPLVLAHDLDDGLAQHWITALCAAGQYDVARTFFLAFRRRFRKEMRDEPAIRLPDPAGTARAGPAAGGGQSTTTMAGPNQLPKDIHYFTGHDQLLSQLDNLTDPDLAGENAVAITGMPGVGKTTLVTYWAHRRRHRFPDGQLFLNLQTHGPAPIGPADALGRFLHALGVSADRIPPGEEERRDRLNQLLTGRRLLIVLDDIADSGQARRLLTTSKTCVTLITGRNRLKGLTIREGVRNLTIPPLPYGECLRLLRQIIGPRRADAEAEAMQVLSNRSGGLPLAVRIIGEHIAERPLARIADLVDGLIAHLLTAGSDEDEGANLQGVFAWSYEALDQNTARLFRRLGLFPGSSISPEAAASMLGTAAVDSELLLNRLAKANLIGHDTAWRYALHDLLRRYAKERADREESATDRRDVMRRLLDWYVLTTVAAAAVLAPGRPAVPDLPEPSMSQPLTFPTGDDAMRWGEAERANLGSLTRWAAENGFHRHAWQIPAASHEMFDRYGRQSDQLAWHRVALSSAQADGHHAGHIGTLGNLGGVLFAMHNYRQAAAAFEAAIQLGREVGYLEYELPCTHNLGAARLRTGDVTAALRIYQELLAAYQARSDSFMEASTLYWLAETLGQMGQHDQAIESCQQAIVICKRLGYLVGAARGHSRIGGLYLKTGQQRLALDHCRRALDTRLEARLDEAAICDALITISEAERQLDMYDAAIRDAQGAVSLSEEMSDPWRRCRALVALAATFSTLGRDALARQHGGRALDIVNELSGPDVRPIRDQITAILCDATPSSPPEPVP